MASVVCVEVPRETNEWLPLNVEVNGLPLASFDTAITAVGVRPSTWTPTVTLDGEPGVMVDGLTPGTYKVWVKVTAAPQEIVIHVGNVVVT